MPARRPAAAAGLTVAVTGPTGEIGGAFLKALDRHKDVARVIGMARRPFDPAARGLRKVEYHQGDVLDRASVDALVAGADVVVHLAFIIMGSLEESRHINLEGSRNVFEATLAAGAKRLVYTSSVAAYGFHAENPEWLTEDVPPRGTHAHYYSEQKAELEGVLAELLAGSRTDAYVFRPCIVAGAEAQLLLETLVPYTPLAEHVPDVVRRLLDGVPFLKPVLPDPGTPFQLVHHDDVATALRAAVLGRGAPGTYNLAAEGVLTFKDLADELDWYSVPVPELAVDVAAEFLARLPFVPAQASWIQAFREPVLMDCAKARRELGWRPAHDAHATLRETVMAAREDLLVR